MLEYSYWIEGFRDQAIDIFSLRFFRCKLERVILWTERRAGAQLVQRLFFFRGALHRFQPIHCPQSRLARLREVIEASIFLLKRNRCSVLSMGKIFDDYLLVPRSNAVTAAHVERNRQKGTKQKTITRVKSHLFVSFYHLRSRRLCCCCCCHFSLFFFAASPKRRRNNVE